MVYLAIVLVVFIIDMFSKWLIVKHLEIGEQIRVIGDFFVITSHRNQGAAFGILQGQRWFFIAFTVLVAIGLIWYIRRTVSEGKKLLPVALSLVLGGALGNFVDRAWAGEVVDFLQFYFAVIDYTYPIFNVADSAIVVGVGMIVWDAWMDWKREKKERQHESREI